MNRFAKIIRTLGGFVLLLQLVCFTLPFLKVTQENYPDITVSQFSYLKDLFADGQFFAGDSKDMLPALFLLIVLPVLLSVIFGLWGIVSSRRQIVSGLGAIAVAALDIAFLWKVQLFYPDRINDAQNFQRGYGWICLAVIALLSAVTGILVICTRPSKRKVEKAEVIPDLEQMQRDQLKPQYEFIDESKPGKEIAVSDESGRSAQAAGIMLGLTGVFKGAEIPFQPGETLKLGRDNSNDLVFTQAARVSRCHCEITWLPDKNKFQILDHSSNGCFVNGREECIPQNIAIELEPGTVLDVGDRNNRFRLG